MTSGIAAQVKDPFLIFAVTGIVLGLLGTGAQYMLLGRKSSALTQRQQQSAADSTRYAAVLADRGNAQTARDSVVRQFSIIQAIDGERYTWPHILDELSAALPPVTWLRSVVQTSPVVSIATRDSAVGGKAQKIEAAANAAMAAAAIPHMQLRVIGQTVDPQAMTRYMRLLEASPFIEGVTLVGTNIVQVDGRDATEFTLDMSFQTPDRSAIKTVPLSVAVR